MKPWLDDLSEDWVQPSNPASPNGGPSSSPAGTSQTASSVQRSRLPRMRNSSGSFSEIPVNSVMKSALPPRRTRTALGERSRSENNVPSPDASQRPRSSEFSRRLSESTSSAANSVIQNTIIEPESPTGRRGKTPQIQHTPEWKRRILKGERGYGDQLDLFSPMGLENMFHKPSRDSSSAQRHSTKGLPLKNTTEPIPSSPPPWTSAGKLQDNGGRQDMAQTDEKDGLSEENEGQEHRSQLDAEIKSNIPIQENGRTASQQLELDNENFSPVLLSTNHRVGGTFRLAPLVSQAMEPVAEEKPQKPSSPRLPTVQVSSAHSDHMEDTTYSRFQEDSLPEDLPAGTPDITDMGAFVCTRRGGYSQDGSFRARRLSPSPKANPATGTPREESSMLVHRKDTKVVRKVRDAETSKPATPPSRIPITPNRRRDAKSGSPERALLSASPLKLFDAHDTFTSNRLQRRLSQLESKGEGFPTTETESQNKDDSTSPNKLRYLTPMDEASLQHTATEAIATPSLLVAHPPQPKREAFGLGGLDDYEFSNEFSVLPSSDDPPEESSRSGSPSLHVPAPGSKQPIGFNIEDLTQTSSSRNPRRQGLTRIPSALRRPSATWEPLRRNVEEVQQARMRAETQHTDGKRGPTSPFKQPTPKRRRTLHEMEEDSSSESGLSYIKNTHAAIQSVIGRKRKDARPDPSKNVADPEVLARRHILRPRNPTPNQRRRAEIQAEILEETEAFIQSSPGVNDIRQQLNSSPISNGPKTETQAKAVASEVAAFSLQRAKVMKDAGRKRSVTTQDFLDEAVKIMEFIRTKGRPTSALASLEETETETEVPDPVLNEAIPSTPLTFSRPPSRDGRPSVWREPNKRELDPRVLSHLRKYQEQDSDGFMASSVRSLRFHRVEQSNTRLTREAISQHKTHDKHDDDVDSVASADHTAGSQHYTDSLGRTVGTNASRRSDHVATLAPEAVAHLIPEQIAGMSFDRDKGMWVKQKIPSREHPAANDYSQVTESEDDPLANIPDLTVDESKELVANEASPRRFPIPQGQSTEHPEHPMHLDGHSNSRPSTRDGQPIPSTDSSSVPSKASKFAWSYPKTETRATSWSEQDADRAGTQKLHQKAMEETAEVGTDDVEHEIQYFEGRESNTRGPRSGQVRDLTISFSSPMGVSRGLAANSRSSDLKNQYMHKFSASSKASRGHSGPSVRTFASTRVAPIDEAGELTILENEPRNYRMRLSMNVSTPFLGAGDADALVRNPASPAKFGDVTFMLSDLPDFTVHQVDESELPDRVVVTREGSSISRCVEDRYHHGTAQLVKALQDVEPDEPYWEDLRAVNLCNKDLLNVFRLDEFCHRLEEVNLSNNGISQVKGIPPTVRRLNIRDNCLTGLTSWGCLTNLQHLDISQNDIESLEGLDQLIHLRTLRVDNNKLTSLAGLMELDGLMELSAQGNKIRRIDFARASLSSLSSLNLKDNGLLELCNLQCLPRLEVINLDNNCIDHFPDPGSTATACRALRILRLSNNGMKALDMEAFPDVEELYVDNNSLLEIKGIESLHQMVLLSARGQMAESHEVASPHAMNLMKNVEVRELRISLNTARSLDVLQPYFNLQRLELASMGLKQLPDTFGQLMPNVRSLNLNFNSITDLRPLLNIKKLNEVLLAGNKLSRLRTNIAVLAKLAALSTIDLRENPMTMRFYAPAAEHQLISLKRGTEPLEEDSRFVLGRGSTHSDEVHLARLDDETKLRRRVYEMLVASSCAHVQVLDGLDFDIARVMAKDEVWERLLYLGVIKKTSGLYLQA